MQKTLPTPIGVRLLDALPDARVFGDLDVRCQSCTDDLSRVQPGDVFFCTSDESASHAPIALEQGAVAVVTDTFLPVFGAPQFVTTDARASYSQLCQHLVGNPSHDLSLVGVTGAHGKTTVSRLLTGVLRSEDLSTACLADGLETDGMVTRRSDQFKLSAPRMARWLGESLANGCRHAITEVTPQGVLDGCYAGLKFGVVCLTNLSFDRTTSRSVQREREIATSVVEGLAPFATLVANADDPECVKIAAERHGNTLTYGFDKPADLTAVVIESHAGGTTMMVTQGCDTVAIDLAYVGAALAQNCLAAIATAVAVGIDLSAAARGVEASIRLPGVMQSTACGQEFPVFHDQAATPQRLRATLSAARGVAKGRVIAVLPESPSKSLCSVATALGDLVVIPQSHFQSDDDSAASVRWVEDRFSGIALALALAEPDDVVLVAGAAKQSAVRDAEDATMKQLLSLRLSNTRESCVM